MWLVRAQGYYGAVLETGAFAECWCGCGGEANVSGGLEAADVARAVLAIRREYACGKLETDKQPGPGATGLKRRRLLTS